MTTYYVDMSTNLTLGHCSEALPIYNSPAGSWPSTSITWRRLRQESVRVEGDTIIERWLVIDTEADPELEGTIVEPFFKQDYDYETQVSKSYVAGRRFVAEMPKPPAPSPLFVADRPLELD